MAHPLHRRSLSSHRSCHHGNHSQVVCPSFFDRYHCQRQHKFVSSSASSALGLIVVLVVALVLSSLRENENAVFESSILLLRHQEDKSKNIIINNNSNNNTTTRATTVLWLVTCETRVNNEAFFFWNFTATLVQQMAEQQQQQQQQNKTVRVKIKNPCAGLTFEKVIMKLQVMQQFCQNLVATEATTTTTTTTTTTAKNKNYSAVEYHHLVLFTDSDAIFNPFAVTATQAIQRYREITSSDDDDNNNNKILISAEPSLFLGVNHQVIRPVIQQLYSSNINSTNSNNNNNHNNHNTRSNCPKFLNSGQYMGHPAALLKMLDQALSPSLQKFVQGVQGNPQSDQARLNHWYARSQRRQQQQQQPTTSAVSAVLDVNATLFRSLSYGIVSSETKDKATGRQRRRRHPFPGADQAMIKKRPCGVDPPYDCGEFQTPYLAQLLSLQPKVAMPPVPNCPFSPEIQFPFSLHGNGPSFNKKWLLQIARELLTAFCDQNQRSLQEEQPPLYHDSLPQPLLMLPENMKSVLDIAFCHQYHHTQNPDET